MKRFWLAVRLRWHGYCPKHLTRRETYCATQSVISYCAECEHEEQLRKNALEERLIAEMKAERGEK